MEPIVNVDTEELDEMELDPWRAMPLHHGDHPAADIRGHIGPDTPAR
ncbi:hypothetical protein [Microbacterium candidum]|uniref:Uncharacterized protein n=1 Tax=Microbacterium candidum TaxID=3041922 RepID=A0ABT7MXK3_9MICO|nr:hypothetical protein [Microbacterium sp. ASV49]MDL9979178.1 hypothetical protein [Microbacterium sp. ASV49]